MGDSEQQTRGKQRPQSMDPDAMKMAHIDPGVGGGGGGTQTGGEGRGPEE